MKDANEMERESGNARQLCTFLVGGLLYGIEVVNVQEVIRHQEMTRVPLAPPDVRGLINLRGQIVAAIDTRKRLGVEGPVPGEPPMNVVVRTVEGATSLLVDEIGDVIEVTADMRDAIPETVPTGVRRVIAAIHKLPNQLLLELDIDKLIEGAASRAA